MLQAQLKLLQVQLKAQKPEDKGDIEKSSSVSEHSDYAEELELRKSSCNRPLGRMNNERLKCNFLHSLWPSREK